MPKCVVHIFVRQTDQKIGKILAQKIVDDLKPIGGCERAIFVKLMTITICKRMEQAKKNDNKFD